MTITTKKTEDLMLGVKKFSKKIGGHVTFSLKGEYEKLSFVVWPANVNSNGDKHNAIYTVKLDGRKLLDEVVWEHDAPREAAIS